MSDILNICGTPSNEPPEWAEVTWEALRVTLSKHTNVQLPREVRKTKA
uniref:Uncharacterized protein n=1 Tax=Anguilla anguilla TaxID=7936 RepID=A0A0E9QAR7_ANGAN